MARGSVRVVSAGAALFVLAHLAAAVGGELLGQCPSEQTTCPARAAPCTSDEECGAEHRCCAASCGRVCLEPLYTGCENVRVAAERAARALAEEAGPRSGRRAASGAGVRTPRCRTADGEFEPVQCDNEIVSSCWCVDAAGFEVAGTRAPAAALVNCTRPAACAAHTCRMLCPLGFELDAKGCPLCRCRDPCAGVRCPSALSCQLEETPCLREPCPPVPTCKRGRSLQNICPVGEPLLISETHRPFLCGTDPGKPNCPPLYRCLVDSGNDYGVCCPASLELQKAGSCPAPAPAGEAGEEGAECGTPCAHDLECPSAQKCCEGGECGRHCAMPHNVTECLQQKLLAELLSVSEREGRGYVPQCKPDGAFEPRQCSRNALVCWCVDREGHKLRGSMGPAAGVQCSDTVTSRGSGRALEASRCGRALCASVCEYGYRSGADGCPSCECDDPCAGFPCADGEECVRVKHHDCTGELCTGYPVCRPRITYENPCASGTPYTNATTGEVVSCAEDADCPAEHQCAGLGHSQQALCCPLSPADLVDDEEEVESCPLSADALCGVNGTVSCGAGAAGGAGDGACAAGSRCCATDACGNICVDPVKQQLQHRDSAPTMCEYLRDFDEKMEGTVDGMRLALPQPACHRNGSFVETQCAGGACWCVDSFGTEIPATRGDVAPLADCLKLRTEIECLELTCRMGCDYGFEFNNATRCPTCRCRDPCAGVACPAGRACAMVDVACDGDYCPPVPACLPRKVGQCPYLVPAGGSCEFSCRDDAECGDGERCCATGCGTACARVVMQSACQQRRAHALHAAAERGAPPSALWIPACGKDGAYERVQCRASDATCWCVDPSGVEQPGTRVKNGAVPDCDAPVACPEPVPACSAEEACEHGRALDADGCRTCACRDPCAELVCPGEEVCTLAEVECTGEPCPRLAVCAAAPACPGGAHALPAPDGSGPLACGPAAAACPSSHSCRFAPHDQSPPICCPKPRTVCFERKEEGWCGERAGAVNVTRWYFNRDHNRCEKFRYGGCSTSHNNFHTLEICNAVCPEESATKTSTAPETREVLSRCERLREKNALAAQRYGRPTFTPACDAAGDWEPVQCMHHIDVCWCVSGRGEPQKGSLVRGARPDCNFRRARTHIRLNGNSTQSDEVLEELIRQMTALRVSEFEREDEELPPSEDAADDAQPDERAEGSELEVLVSPPAPAPPRRVQQHIRSKCLALLDDQVKKGSESATVRCQPSGAFSPRQCSDARCWCVDEAGNRLQSVDNFPETNDVDPCEHTRVESVQVELGYLGALSEAAAESARAALAARLAALGARVPVALERTADATRLRFILRQHNKVDLVYHLETLVKEEKARGAGPGEAGVGVRLVADVIRADYRLAAPPALAMQHREILSESTVSSATSYHTALIVLAATSAFIISVLSVLLMLYRAKLARREPPKLEERFLPYSPPVYVLSSDEKADLARVLHSSERSPADVPRV